jgi:multisubunit Na+/H+ antiporter MnhB subunit
MFIAPFSMTGYVCNAIPLSDLTISSTTLSDISVLEISLAPDLTVNVHTSPGVALIGQGSINEY